MKLPACLQTRIPARYQKLTLGLASFSVLWKVALLLVLWPVLSQEGHPVKTSLALLQLTVLHRPYAQISEQPETYLLGHDRQMLLRDHDLVLKDQLGAVLLFDQHGHPRCATTHAMTRWFSVIDFSTACQHKT